MTRLVLVVPQDLEAPTGGTRYNRALVTALRERGTQVDVRPAPGRWPVGSAPERSNLLELLQVKDTVLVDGLVAAGAPDAVAAAVAGGSRVHVLVHLPLALETGLDPAAAERLDELERACLRAATGVVATSHWAAADLFERHGVRAGVACPGTGPAAAATGSGATPRLLQLASLTPRKGQLVVVEALASIRDLPWSADLTGALDAAPDYVTRVRAAVEEAGLTGRVRLTGPLTGDDLETVWAATDLLLLPSHAETWGMAVTEALSRGIPAVVGRGTGAEEALGRAPDGTLPGAVVPAGDPSALADALRHLLGPGRRAAARAAAQRAGSLTGWSATADAVLKNL